VRTCIIGWYIQVLNAYLKFMTDIGVLLGGSNSNCSIIMQRMQEVVVFEQAIAQVVCIFFSSVVQIK